MLYSTRESQWRQAPVSMTSYPLLLATATTTITTARAMTRHGIRHHHRLQSRLPRSTAPALAPLAPRTGAELCLADTDQQYPLCGSHARAACALLCGFWIAAVVTVDLQACGVGAWPYAAWTNRSPG